MRPLFIIKPWVFWCRAFFHLWHCRCIYPNVSYLLSCCLTLSFFFFLIQAVTFLSRMRIPHRTLLFYCALMCDRRVRVIINPMHFASVPCMIELWHYRNQTTATFTKWRLLTQTRSHFSHEGTHPHVHTFDTSGRVILTQQLPVAHFPQVAWPFKQG